MAVPLNVCTPNFEKSLPGANDTPGSKVFEPTKVLLVKVVGVTGAGVDGVTGVTGAGVPLAITFTTPSGLCAERTALFYANSKYPDSKIVCLAIVAGSMSKINETPIAPCGGCRQVISEFETKQASPIGIYFMGEKGKIVYSNSIINLLPFKFDSSFL